MHFYYNNKKYKKSTGSFSSIKLTSASKVFQESTLKKREISIKDTTPWWNGQWFILQIEVAQRVKNLHAMQETRVQFLGWEDSLEKEMANHSSILAWKIPWTEKPGRLESMGSKRVGHNWATNTLISKSPPPTLLLIRITFVSRGDQVEHLQITWHRKRI